MAAACSVYNCLSSCLVGEGQCLRSKLDIERSEICLHPPEITVKLKPCGEVVKEQLQHIENRFPNVSVEDYVIMPDHIHAIIILYGKAGGASPSPTLNDVICAFKSLTSRACKQNV